jgi:hypothetical protein
MKKSDVLIQKLQKQGKMVFSGGGGPERGGGHKERANKSVYGGCILYPYMKIEEQNLLKLF